MKLDELVRYLDSLLRIDAIEDDSPNGLQVEGRPDVTRIGFGVDYCPELADRTAADGMDLLFVHHGLIWGGVRHLRGMTMHFLKPLVRSDLSLYVAHLPLDVHPELGHNIQMARLLDLADPRPFGCHHGHPVGVIGRWTGPAGRDHVLAAIRQRLSSQAMLLPFGGEAVQSVAIISGGAAKLAEQAREAGADFYLTGETSHSQFHLLKELGLNVCFGGHYQTEKWGLLAVLEHLRERGLADGRFYDLPTPF